MQDETDRPRRFSHDEVGELIETATRLEHLGQDGDGLDEDDVRSVAAELGISQDALDRALEERRKSEADRRAAVLEAGRAQAARIALEEKRREQRLKSLNEWRSHAASYVGVIGGLAAIDWLTGGGFDWFYYPAAGWGIGFFIHTFKVLFRVEE